MRGLKYIGKGDFVAGVPARDLSLDEVRKFGGKAKLLSTGLYKLMIIRKRYKPVVKPTPAEEGNNG